MPFQITITEKAERHFDSLSARDRGILEAAINNCLSHQPLVVTNAIKRLRPNPIAEFELRAGSLRALYNVEGDEVVIVVVRKKVGNKLIVEWREFDDHQDNPSE